jgi:hypothetical protein
MDKGDEVRITLRLPAKLQASLKVSAKQSGRSMNAEIVKLLEKTADVDFPSECEDLKTRQLNQCETVEELRDFIKEHLL